MSRQHERAPARQERRTRFVDKYGEYDECEDGKRPGGRAPRTERLHSRSEVSPRAYSLAFTDNSAKALRQTTTRKLNRGDLHMVQVPHLEDDTQYKTRPAIIVAQVEGDVFVLPLTSSERGVARAAYALEDWDRAGLKKQSSVRGEILTVDRLRVGTHIGSLSEADAGALSFWLDMMG